MKILITNNRLDLRGGAEMWVRDLARALQARGHLVFAYSSDPGEGERLLESDPVAVSTNLEDLPFQPDIIHAQHHLDAMSALAALPDVPALYHCHGAVWRECPPRHPRIYRYLAISRTAAERMMVESNITPAEITVWPNVIDTTRFRTVRTLSARPARALFFNGHHRPESETVAAVRAAAEECGLALDFAGFHFHKRIERPETSLPNYDIVFASGKSALDAMACGCAVIVLGRTSCGPMVLPENFAALRDVNFSIAVNSAPPSKERIVSEIRKFSATESARATEQVRREADITPAVETLLGIYQAIITQHRARPVDFTAEMHAVSRYLRRLVPLIKALDAEKKLGHSATAGVAAEEDGNA